MAGAPSPPPGSAGFRLALGMAQIGSGAVALGLLVRTGLDERAIVATVVTCLLTTISLLLYGGPRLRRPRTGTTRRGG